MLVIVLHRRDCGREMRRLEVKSELLAQQLKLSELLLLFADLASVAYDSLPERLVRLCHLLDLVFEVVVVQLRHFFIGCDLGVVVAIGFLELIVLLVQLVHVVEELYVLLLRLDESCHDFINVSDSSRFHNRLECLLDDLSVADILVQKALLLDVLRHDRVQADHQDFDWVCELLLAALRLVVLHCATQGLVVEFNLLVLLLELLLQELDVGLEGLLAFLVLALERQDLIVRLGGLPRVVEALFVSATCLLFELLDCFFHLTDAFLREEDLVSHTVDSHSQVLVVAFDVVKEDLFVLELVLERLEEGLLLVFGLDLLWLGVESVVEVAPSQRFLSLLGCSTRVLVDFVLDFLLDLLQLLVSLLVSVGEDQEALALVLQLARVVVGFGLQAHRLRLIKALPSSHEFIVV